MLAALGHPGESFAFEAGATPVPREPSTPTIRLLPIPREMGPARGDLLRFAWWLRLRGCVVGLALGAIVAMIALALIGIALTILSIVVMWVKGLAYVAPTAPPPRAPASTPQWLGLARVAMFAVAACVVGFAMFYCVRRGLRRAAHDANRHIATQLRAHGLCACGATLVDSRDGCFRGCPRCGTAWRVRPLDASQRDAAATASSLASPSSRALAWGRLNDEPRTKAAWFVRHRNDAP
jgi:hypothetical protein